MEKIILGVYQIVKDSEYGIIVQGFEEWFQLSTVKKYAKLNGLI